MLRMGLSLVLSVIVVFFSGYKFIAFLKTKKIGQTMYELGPDTHLGKQGTPIMGGLLFIVVSIVFPLLLHKGTFSPSFDFIIALYVFMILNMLIGFADDYIKAYKLRNLGLTAVQKLIAQTIIAILFSIYCYSHENIGSSFNIPFTVINVDLGIFYIPLTTLFIIFMVNSANIQDGMDGLLSSVSIVGFLSWGLISLSLLQLYFSYGDIPLSTSYQNVATFAFALAGGCMGFLRFNYYPAKVFMGDTGSMYIGAASVGVSMVLRQPFLLLLICFTPIMSSLSVILQRAYFKITKGKRIFRMSPVHHHFEKLGYSEPQVITLYVVITTILSMLAILSIYGITTTML